jgi:regulator of protease activity HflC (stomatin/prohibitin superfamily)
MFGSLVFKIVAIILLLIVTFGVGSFALSLMNAPSDISVGAGLGILAVLVIGLAFLIPVLIKWCKKNVDQITSTFPVMIGILILAIPLLQGCTTVGPGHVGIKVNQTGDDRGVSELGVSTGWVWYNPFTQKVFEYPTFVQTAKWTHSLDEGKALNEEISFNSKEGMQVTCDISLSYSLKPEKVPHFYVKFRNDDLTQFTHGFLRNIARDAFNEVGGKYSIEDIYGPKKDEVLGSVRKYVQDQVDSIGVQLEQFGFIGAPRPPTGVVDAINAKITSTQKAMQAENEVRQIKAEAQKAIEKARGEAEANRIVTASITPVLLEWRRLSINELAVPKWDGKLSSTVVYGNATGGHSGLIMQLPIDKQ